MKRTYVLIFTVLFSAVSIFALEGCARDTGYDSIENSVPTISVQGEGKVEVKPDEAIARFGVTSEDKSLAKAYAHNTTRMNAIISKVKELGIESEDITTSSYNVMPVYPRDEKGYQKPGKPEAFHVSQELTIKMNDVSKAGSIIDGVILSGSNTFNGIWFDSSKIEEIQEEAKVKAAEDAKRKAELLTKGLGVKLGRVIKVSASSPRVYTANKMRTMEAMAMSTAPQVEAGTMEVTATCNVIYEIVQ